jgi:acetyl-CoA synthetase (ADP-forming)
MNVVNTMTRVNEIIQKCRDEGRINLTEYESRQIAETYELPIPPSLLASNEESALESATKLGFPSVLKIISPDILHKSDAGGVILNLTTPEEVKTAYRKIIENAKKYNPKADIRGVLVQQMVPKGREIIIGMVKDPQFGSAIMFGLGGIFVEVLKDVTFRVTPLKKQDAEEMIKEIKGYPILSGIRGQKPIDFKSLIKALLSVSKLATEHPEVAELDLNPIMAFADRIAIVDARIILEKR